MNTSGRPGSRANDRPTSPRCDSWGYAARLSRIAKQDPRPGDFETGVSSGGDGMGAGDCGVMVSDRDGRVALLLCASGSRRACARSRHRVADGTPNVQGLPELRQPHKNGEPAHLLHSDWPLSPGARRGRGVAGKGGTAVLWRFVHRTVDQTLLPSGIRRALGIRGSGRNVPLFRPDTGRTSVNAATLFRSLSDGVPRQLRRSASTQHSRSRPYRAESDTPPTGFAFRSPVGGPSPRRS